LILFLRDFIGPAQVGFRKYLIPSMKKTFSWGTPIQMMGRVSHRICAVRMHPDYTPGIQRLAAASPADKPEDTAAFRQSHKNVAERPLPPDIGKGLGCNIPPSVPKSAHLLSGKSPASERLPKKMGNQMVAPLK